MQLYDQLITEFLRIPEIQKAKQVPCAGTWPEDTQQTMILRGDMAYELGGDLRPSVGCTLMTMEQGLVPEDAVSVVGPGLEEIKAGSGIPYARITLVRLNPQMKLQGEALYSAIRNLEYTRYHFYPKGFMIRISASRSKESVRVSREALEKGLSFGMAGKILENTFHKDPNVQAVHTFFITAPDFDYKKLEELSESSEKITKTIDHIFKNIIMDCKACSLQEVCNQVEGLKELHFSQQQTHS